MIPEAQRISIAEACGWRIYKSNGGKYYERPGGNVRNCSSYIGDLPDYLSDLNDMHEAEKMLVLGQREVYWDELLTLCGHWGMVVAPADRRAKAFLRAIGKWTE